MRVEKGGWNNNVRKTRRGKLGWVDGPKKIWRATEDNAMMK